MRNILDIADEVLSDPMEPPFDEDDPGELLDYLSMIEAFIKTLSEFPLVEIGPSSASRIYFAGDLHGDLLTAGRIFAFFVNETKNSHYDGIKGPVIVFLGDYIDRAPEDIPNGGFLTALFVLSMKVFFPRNVILLRGNHEAYDLKSFIPHDLPDEIRELFGESNTPSIYSAMFRIFDLLPLFARTSRVIIASHAAFPISAGLRPESVTERDVEDILRTLWGDSEGSPTERRSIDANKSFNEQELRRFLSVSDSSILLRGHDQNMKGIPFYSGKVLTVLTSRTYEKSGREGIFLAFDRLDTDEPIEKVTDLRLVRFREDDIIEMNVFEIEEGAW